MALTIATGFVVDDAIVVLENISRHIERGMPPLAGGAARRAGGRLHRAVHEPVADRGVHPILLMGGIVGRLFREFAVDAVGGDPDLAGGVADDHAHDVRAAAAAAGRSGARAGSCAPSEAAFDWLHALTSGACAWRCATRASRCCCCAATVVLNVYLYVIVPKGFFPQQDTGRLIGSIQADQSISFQAMSQKLADFMDIVGADPAVDNVVGFTGGGQRNTGNHVHRP